MIDKLAFKLLENCFTALGPEFKVKLGSSQTTTTTGIERARAQYLPLLWPVRQSGGAVEHNNVILYLGLHTTGRVTQTPISSCLFVLRRPQKFGTSSTLF